MKYKPISERNIDLLKENECLRAQLAKAEADTAYVAMMADVELEQEVEAYEPEV